MATVSGDPGDQPLQDFWPYDPIPPSYIECGDSDPCGCPNATPDSWLTLVGSIEMNSVETWREAAGHEGDSEYREYYSETPLPDIGAGNFLLQYCQSGFFYRENEPGRTEGSFAGKYFVADFSNIHTTDQEGHVDGQIPAYGQPIATQFGAFSYTDGSLSSSYWPDALTLAVSQWNYVVQDGQFALYRVSATPVTALNTFYVWSTEDSGGTNPCTVGSAPNLAACPNGLGSIVEMTTCAAGHFWIGGAGVTGGSATLKWSTVLHSTDGWTTATTVGGTLTGIPANGSRRGSTNPLYGIYRITPPPVVIECAHGFVEGISAWDAGGGATHSAQVRSAVLQVRITDPNYPHWVRLRFRSKLNGVDIRNEVFNIGVGIPGGATVTTRQVASFQVRGMITPPDAGQAFWPDSGTLDLYVEDLDGTVLAHQQLDFGVQLSVYRQSSADPYGGYLTQIQLLQQSHNPIAFQPQFDGPANNTACPAPDPRITLEWTKIGGTGQILYGDYPCDLSTPYTHTGLVKQDNVWCEQNGSIRIEQGHFYNAWLAMTTQANNIVRLDVKLNGTVILSHTFTTFAWPPPWLYP